MANECVCKPNVGISGGRISAISKQPLSGAENINASGLVFLPGFVDTHFHAVDIFGTKMALCGGVATGMDLELGSFNVKKQYGEKDQGGWQINYGMVSGRLMARMAVHDPEVNMDGPPDYSDISRVAGEVLADGVSGYWVTKSSIEDMNKVLQILDEDLRQGALGVGVGEDGIQTTGIPYVVISGWLNEHTIGLNADLAIFHTEDNSGAGAILHGDR